MLNSFTTGLLGCAPTPSQYRIRSTLHSIFFCVGTSAPGLTLACPGTGRGTGSYTPNTSSGLASRAFLALMTTRLRLFVERVWPGGRASLIRTTILDLGVGKSRLEAALKREGECGMLGRCLALIARPIHLQLIHHQLEVRRNLVLPLGSLCTQELDYASPPL